MKAKNLIAIILFIALCIYLLACKKNDSTPPTGIANAQLTGVWAEQSPCVAGPGSCYTLKFTSSNKCIFSYPFTDSPAYNISNGDSIIFTGNPYLSSYKIELLGDTQLTIEKLYKGSSTGGPPPAFNVIFKRM